MRWNQKIPSVQYSTTIFMPITLLLTMFSLLPWPHCTILFFSQSCFVCSSFYTFLEHIQSNNSIKQQVLLFNAMIVSKCNISHFSHVLGHKHTGLVFLIQNVLSLLNNHLLYECISRNWTQSYITDYLYCICLAPLLWALTVLKQNY